MTSPEELEGVRRSLSFWLKRWSGNPLAYVLECVGDVPTHQQAVILNAFGRHNFVAVKSGHGIGKSKLTGWLVNWWLDTRGKRAPVTGAGGDQLSDIVWPEVMAVARKKWKWLGEQYEGTSEELRYVGNREGCKAVLRTARADNDDALQGFHDCMFFIDEASGVRDGIFEVASGAMGDPGAYGFLDGNPTRLSGYMYNIFHRRTFWHCLSFSSEDSLAEREYKYPYVDPMGEVRWIHVHGRQTEGWIRNMRLEYGLESNAYRVRVLGEFANVGRDQVVEQRWLDRVHVEQVLKETDKKGKRRMGIDPAWTGDDDTGLVIREGSRILHVESWHGFDVVESFNRARMLYEEWKCDAVHVDTVGVGAGLYDMFCHAVNGSRVGYPAVRVHCSESAPEDRDGKCAKLRDWLWWKARKYFREKSVSYCGGAADAMYVQLLKELGEPTYRIRPDGSVKVEDKDELRKRGLRSPNVADAFNLTLYGDYELFQAKYVTGEDLRRAKGIKARKVRLGWKGC